jgi:hypothetical protein
MDHPINHNGSFQGQVMSLWMVEKGERDRKMKLLEDFGYIDPEGVTWAAPNGSIINGASIPAFLWGPLVGSPYTGDYRMASVVHDVACDERTQPYEKVHLMFYYAMLCGETQPWLAKMMYTAVKLFGPRWGTNFAALSESSENIAQFFDWVHSDEFHQADIQTLQKMTDVFERSRRL